MPRICPPTTRPGPWVTFCRPRGWLCKEEQTASSVQVLGLLSPEPLVVWSQRAIEGSHKDTFSPRGRHKGRLFHISRQPAHSVKAAEGEESSKHPGRRAWRGQQIKTRGWWPGHTGPLHPALAATRSPLSVPTGCDDGDLLIFLLEERPDVPGKRVCVVWAVTAQ